MLGDAEECVGRDNTTRGPRAWPRYGNLGGIPLGIAHNVISRGASSTFEVKVSVSRPLHHLPRNGQKHRETQGPWSYNGWNVSTWTIYLPSSL
jgi:hypothetical protein